jgi:demethylmenaquinone methyltransferase / 2-methoxy-6-polyprenyl-1,4-benzoquinol methylase
MNAVPPPSSEPGGAAEGGMAADPRLALVERFFKGTGSTYDFMVNAATFGIDRLWKRRIVDCIPPRAESILDLACGTGISTFAIARRFPLSRVVGVDLREEYLAIARAKPAPGPARITFTQSRAEDFRSATSFDCICGSYLPKYADLPRLVASWEGLLRPGGTIVMHDFTFPPGRLLVALWRLYFVALRLIGGLLYPSWKEIYRGLPQLIQASRWLPELTHELASRGYEDIRVRDLTAYGSAIVTARKPTPSSPS